MPTNDLYPHYNDPRFQNGQSHTVFVSSNFGRDPSPTGYGNEEVEGAHYIYDDRIPGEAHDKARQEVEDDHSVDFFEKLIQHTLKRSDVELVHIVVNVDPITAYPRHIYGYVTGESQE
jgi:hypothetical protein